MKTYNFVYKTMFSDGRYYIGQHKTDNLDDNYYGSGKTVQDLLKNHPELQPKRIILKYCDTQEELNYYEKYYIGDNYKNDPMCLNITNICVIKNEPWIKGKHLSEETKKKLSESLKGRQISEETKRKMSESSKGKNKGKPAWNKGKKGIYTEEVKRKMSESLKGRDPWIKGKHHSEETKKKMSENRKGRDPWNKGKHHSEETRKKISEIKKNNYIKRIWIHNNESEKLINISDVEKYISNNWIKGRK